MVTARLHLTSQTATRGSVDTSLASASSGAQDPRFPAGKMHVLLAIVKVLSELRLTPK
jgi:hypothetical protein